MRNTVVHSLASIMLFVVPSCMVDVSSDPANRELTSDPALDDEASGANSTPRQISGDDLQSRSLGLEKEDSNVFSCGGVLGPYAGAGNWWKYGLYNCNPYTIRVQVFRVDGSGGPCFTLAPSQTVWDWIQGNIVGKRGC